MENTQINKPSWSPETRSKASRWNMLSVEESGTTAIPEAQAMPIHTPLPANWETSNNLMRSLMEEEANQGETELQLHQQTSASADDPGDNNAGSNLKLSAKLDTEQIDNQVVIGNKPTLAPLVQPQTIQPLNHVVQQNEGVVQKKLINETDASNESIQRVKYDNELKKYYSEVLEGQKIDDTNAVVTATSNMGPGGGHTAIYVERIKNSNPENKKIDLVYGAGGGSGSESGASTSSAVDSSSGSSSSSGGQSATNEKGITIRIKDGLTAKESSTKSWVIENAKVDDLIKKAEEIQADQSKYSYTLLGVSVLNKKVLNCAKFGEIILAAAGIDASAGKVFKLPSTLTEGKDVGHEKDKDFLDLAERRKEEEKQRKQQEEQQKQEEERQRQAAQALAKRYDGVKPGRKKATFAEGKIVTGSRDRGGQLNSQFTFTANPQTEADISLTPFSILITSDLINLGRLEVQDVSPRGSYYIRLEDILDTTGNIITT